MAKHLIYVLTGLLLITSSAQGADTLITVQSKGRYPDGSWKDYPTRTLSGLSGYDQARTDTAYSRYGGLLRSKHEATGFFYTRKIDGRWFFVDPDGYLFFKVGVAATRIHTGEPYETAFSQKFGSVKNWADQTTALFRSLGFNGTGAFSGDSDMQQADTSLVFSPVITMLRNYGETDYPPGRPVRWKDDVIPIFDPTLRVHMEQQARKFMTPELVNDPNLLGYMSDNELGFYHAELKAYLVLNSDDPNYQGAWSWLRERKGKDVLIEDVTDQDEQAFMGYIAGLYYQMTVEIIKSIDPNHLVMGSRLHGAGKRIEPIIRAAAEYLDVVTINYYNSWGPDLTTEWEKWMDKPFLITEWYVKGEDVAESDPSFTNLGGAGWIVPTQQDRGHFYEHFTLELLESPLCAGWHWYRYIDQIDQVDGDSVNKGMLTNGYENHQPLMDAMRRINTRVYDLIEFFDGTDFTTG
jgi:hypothetical protein